MNERTNTPFKSLFYALSIVPLIIPGILFTVAWILLASPKIGILNLVLQRLFGTDTVFFDIYSLSGMIWVDGLHYSPMAFLLMSAAFRADGPGARGIRDDERRVRAPGRVAHHAAARVAGGLRDAAHPVRARARIVRGAGAARACPSASQVFTSSIYEAVHRYPSQVGLASAYARDAARASRIGVHLSAVAPCRAAAAATRP